MQLLKERFFIILQYLFIGLTLIVSLLTISCSTESPIPEEDVEEVEEQQNTEDTEVETKEEEESEEETEDTTPRIEIIFINPGFENGTDGWEEIDPASISGDANSGSKSMKISGAGGKISQTLDINDYSDYTLTAYIKGGGTVGIVVGDTIYYETISSSEFELITINFNAGTNTSITIYGEYTTSECRFDDFELIENIDESDLPEDNTPPSSISNLSAIPGPNSVVLSWDNPTDADFDYVQILYLADTVKTEVQGHTINDLSDGVSYEFNLVAFDKSGNSSENKSIAASPITLSGDKPTDIIPSLVDWKLTLPIDKNGDDSKNADNVDSRNTNPLEIKDDNLIDFDYSPYFYANNNEVYFRGHCAGATTSGSKYPRSELRQRVGGGDNYWSVEDFQYLQTTLRVTHVPVIKPEVSMVQIHGPQHEPLRVQYHADHGLFLIYNEDYNTKSDALDYILGENVRVTVTVNDGDITCKIENLDQETDYSKTWTSSDATGYFKVGCYTQSSIFLSEFKEEYDDNEPIDAYAEVAVSAINLIETYP